MPLAERGFTSVELMVSVAIIGLVGTMATLASANYLGSIRMHKVANQLADTLRIARARAVGETETWEVSVGQDILTARQTVTVRTKGQDWTCRVSCSELPWVTSSRYSFKVDSGVGIVPTDPASELVTFGYAEKLMEPAAGATFEVCTAITKDDGTIMCRPGQSLLVTVKQYSGITIEKKE